MPQQANNALAIKNRTKNTSMDVRWHYGCSIPYGQKRILKMFQKIKTTYVSVLCLTSKSHHSPHMQIKDFFF